MTTRGAALPEPNGITSGKNPVWRWLKRSLVGLLTALIVAGLLGASYQVFATQRDRKLYPPPGQLVDVGGYKLHIHSLGENRGNPTVILLGCGGCMMPNWGWVQPEIAQLTRVVAYDRAGMGWSEPSPTPRTSEQMIAELQSALEVAAIPGPYVLVGHSLGGLIARVYAARHPEQVVGMVLIDPRHPDQEKHWPEAARATDASEKSMIRLLGWLARLGVLRLTPIGHEQASDLPPAQRDQYAALWATTRFWQTLQNQDSAVAQLDAEARSTKSLGDLPLIVLSATTAWYSPGAPADEARQVFTALNLEQTALSTNSLHRTVEGASHTSLVNQERHAQGVVAAVRQVLDTLRTEQRLAE